MEPERSPIFRRIGRGSAEDEESDACGESRLVLGRKMKSIWLLVAASLDSIDLLLIL